MSLVPQPLKTGSLYRQAAYNYNKVNDKKGKNEREFKMYDATAATTPQILLYNEAKQKLCTLFTCLFHFCTFLSRSRQICDVK